MTATVKRWGSSVGVVIPKALADELGLSPGTPLEITREADAVVLRRRGRRARRSIDEIVRQMTPRKPLPGWDDTPPVGREIW